MYVVRNITKRTVVLADLRAEIGPYKMLDLEKVAHREAINRSSDLRLALNTSRLRLLSTGIVRENEAPQIKVVEKHHYIEKEKSDLSEAKLIAMMRKILSEQSRGSQPSGDNKEILNAMTALKNQIDSLNISGGGEKKSGVDMPSIDPDKLADLQSKAVAKISEDVETGNVKSGRKVILKNTKLDDLANELD